MKPSGYSGTPLIDKLGYKLDETICLVDAPAAFKAYLNEEFRDPITTLPAQWLHGFFTSQAQLRDFLDTTDLAKIAGGFWVSWPKKSSGIETDLTEQTFRDLILPTGWVDTKVCAIDDTWSGLKFLRRKQT